MLINATEKEESRVAVVDERGFLENLIIESSAKGQIKGNIYKAVIVNVDPGLEAAFIDYGGNRHGFLPLSDVQQKYYNTTKEVSPQKAHEFLKKGTELMVQAEREEVMHKGAVFTTFLSLPGRFMVVMPESTGGGISRKIEDENERKNLKETIKILKNDEDNIAIIIRTAGVGHDDQSLKDDYQDLVKEYKNILQLFAKKKGPGLIFEDLDMTIRSLRDYFTKDIEEVHIDSFTVYKKAVEFFRRFMPEHLKAVKQYRDKRPLFARYNVESQIEQMFERMSPLPSGGTICIDPTEALISIDVNSGGAKSEEGQEMLAFQTNVEAAVEVARQLRLRNLGGLVVIDFIDMSDLKFRRIVEDVLRDVVKKDKARIEISPIGKFGLLEMSRQRIKANFGSIYKTPCLACDGKGFHRAVPIAASSVIRKISDLALSAGPEGEVRVEAPSTCANYLLNEKRDLLQKIEVDNNIKIKININDSVHAGYETFIINSRKSLDEEEKRESVAKERRERSHSKVGGDKFKKVQKISWKFGEGVIEAKELPSSTQEILNENFYAITKQKPPVSEEPVAIPSPSAITNNNNNNNNNANDFRNSKNKKFKKKFDAPAEETFAMLPENFSSFELIPAGDDELESFETFSEITEESLRVEAEIALAKQIEEENKKAAEAIPLPEKTIENMDTIFSSKQADNPASIKRIVDVKVEIASNPHQENFQSFEIQEAPSDLEHTIVSSNELKEESKLEKNSFIQVPENIKADSKENFTEGVQFLDLSHTSKNFGLGLTYTRPIEEESFQKTNTPIITETIADMQAEQSSDLEDSTEEDSFESNQPTAINEDGIKPIGQNINNQNSGNVQNRDGRNNGNNRPFARRRRRFHGQKNNGQRPPPKNNI